MRLKCTGAGLPFPEEADHYGENNAPAIAESLKNERDLLNKARIIRQAINNKSPNA